MVRSAQHLVGDAERVHDIEGKQRDVRGLEHVAAGVEHEIRRRVGLFVAFLAQSRQHLVAELHLRDVGDLARDLAESLDAVAALVARLVLAPRHRHPRHAEQETRIDPVVAGLDAFAGEHAGARPFARGVRAVAGAQNVDDAGDDRARLGVDAAGARHRTDLDAFAAARARIGHRRDACGQGGFECVGHAASASTGPRLPRPRDGLKPGFAKDLLEG